MDFYNSDAIKSAPEAFPDADLNKDYDYFLRAARSTWAYVLNGRMSVGYDIGNKCGTRAHNGESIKKLRDYYFSRQSVKHIADEIDPEDKDRNRLMNINWKAVDYTTAWYNRAMAEILGFNYKPRTEAIDAMSERKKQDKVNKIKLNNIPQLKQIKQTIGIQDENDVNIDPQDVDALNELKGIQLEIEIDLKNAIERSEQISKTHEVLKTMFVRDQLTANLMTAVVELHPELQIPVAKYVDIERALFAPSAYIDNRDSTIQGYTEEMSTATLRTYLSREKDAKYLNVEQVLYEVSRNYLGKYGNTYPSGWQHGYGTLESYAQQHGSYPHDNFTIPVATFYFIASDIQTYASYTGANGEYNFSQVRKASKTKLAEGTQVQKTIQNVYRVRWIIGTPYIFDYGLDEAVVREGEKGNKRAVLPMVIWHNPAPSVVERVMSKVDEILKCEFKERHLLNEMPPSPAYRIDIKGVQQIISIAGKEWTILDIIEFFKRKGVMVYESTDEWNQQNAATNHPPIDFMTAPNVAQILELSQRKAILLNEIRTIIGINEIADGTQSSAELLNGVTQMANQAVQKALFDSIMMFKGFYKELVGKIGKKFEIMLAAGHEFEGVFFSDNIKKQYKLTKDRLSDNPQFGFSIEVTPSYEEKQALLSTIQQAAAKGEIDSTVLVTVNRLIIGDDLRAAEYLLAKSKEKTLKEQHERQIEIQQAQGKANEQAAVVQAKAQTDSLVQTLTLEYQLKKELAVIEETEKRKTQAEMLASQRAVAGIKAENETTKTVLNAALTPPKPQAQA